MAKAVDLPDASAHYLFTRATQRQDLAYLQVSPDGCILSSGGTLAKYGLETAKVGDAIDHHLLFLTGFFPHPPELAVMPYIQTEQGAVIDVHFIVESGKQWILLFDTANELEKQQQFQQVANDAALLRQQLTKQIDAARGSP